MEVEVRSDFSGRKRRSSTSSTSLSPATKENNHDFKPKRKRTKSESRQQLTFWGWSPKQAKFKPKIMNEQGLLRDHPNPEALSIKSKWQPIVSQFCPRQKFVLICVLEYDKPQTHCLSVYCNLRKLRLQ